MLEYPDVVDKAFLERHGDGDLPPGLQKVNLRYNMARALFIKKYSHLMVELEEKVDRQHNEELNQWNLVLEDVSSTDDISE